MEISYAGSKRCRLRPHPNQNPKSKIQTAPFVGLGQGAGAQKSRTPVGNLFFSDFLIIFDVAFFCVKI